MNMNIVLVSGAVLFKETRGGDRWFIVRHDEEVGWGFPKALTRKVESSARASIRMMEEQGGMNAQVLEEVGRAGGVTTVNDKTLPQRHIYYLMILRSSGEVLGFDQFKWLEYVKVIRMLSSKREKMMLRLARKELRVWRKKEQKRVALEILQEKSRV